MFAVSGLATGLDTGNIISQLIELERRPILQLQEREANFQVELSAYGTLQGLLNDLKSASETLLKPANLKSFNATSSDTTMVNATASDSAAQGSFSITVNELAQSQKLRSAGFATNTEVVGNGTLHLRVGIKPSIDIDISETANLQDVATAINEANAGVSATIIFDGTQHFLTLSAQATGVENTINLTVSDGDGTDIDQAGLSRFVYDVGVTENLTETQAAQDANITVDGITNITRSSNTIDDVISGLNITLQSVSDPLEPVTLTVAQNTSTISDKLQPFFDAYNSIKDFFNKEQKFDETTGTAGSLLGDTTANLVNRQLKSALTSSLTGFQPSLNSLADIGIGFNAEGHLEITSETRFNDALHTDIDTLINFFVKDEPGTQGFAAHFMSVVDGFLDSENGAIHARQSGINRSIKRLQDDVDRIESQVATTQERLEAQFLALELTISELRNTESYLSQQIVALQNLNTAIANRG